MTNRCGRLPEIAEVLGHSDLAHGVINRLYIHTDISTVDELADLTDDQLLDIPGIGPAAVAFIRRRIGG
jgi:hypothetical protein